MIPLLGVVLLIVGLISLMIAANISKKKKEQKRTQDLQLIADEFGWDFEAALTLDSIPGIERLALFDLEGDREITNVMYGAVDGVNATVFDYIYTSGVKHPTTFLQTVVLLEQNGHSLPVFRLRPEEVFDKMFSAFGYQDLDFDQHPEFSRQYILRGEDEAAIRRIFNDQVISFYENNPGTFTDAGENQLFVYRAHESLQPEEIEPFLDLALEISTLMKPS